MATLDNVSIDIAVVLGKTAMPIHQVLRLGRGAIIELDSSEDDEVRILATGRFWRNSDLPQCLSSSLGGCRVKSRPADAGA